MNPWRYRLVALSMAVSLVACSPLETREPAPTHYHLGPPAELVAPAEIANLPRPLTVLKPALAPWLESGRIALLVGGRQLEYAAGARWSAPLPALLHDLARGILSRTGGPLAVRAPQVAGGRYALLLQVEAFHASYGTGKTAPPQLHVELVVSLLDTHRGETLSAVRVSREEQLDENRLQLIVGGLERLFAEALLAGAASMAEQFEDAEG